MGYKEKLRSYAQGKLEGKEKENVEYDIDRQRAIGDYLEESIDSDIFEESKEEAAQSKGEDGELSKLVQRAVSRKLKKFGIWTGAIVLAVALFIMFGLSPLVDAMYYDPGKKLEGTLYGSTISINAIDLPVAVYTELHYPGKYFSSTTVDDEGFARYNINFLFETYDQKFETRQQIMDKGKMEITNKEYKEMNFSDWRFGCLNPYFSSGNRDAFFKGDDTYDVEELEKFPETAIVTAALSFSDDMRLADIRDALGNTGKLLYVAVRTMDHTNLGDTIYGFTGEPSAMGLISIYIPDKEKYPWLSVRSDLLLDKDSDGNLQVKGTNEIMQIWETHFKSMLKFMADQKEFNTIMGIDYQDYRSALKYVEENGVKVYGVVVYGPASEILKIRQDSRVESVYIMDAKLSKFSGILRH